MKYAIAIVAVLFGLLLWTFPAKAQDCFTPQKSLLELNTYTRDNGIQAEAYLYKSPRDARIELLIVWFANAADQVYVSAFREGCMVMMPDGQPGRMAPLTPQIYEAINDGVMVFSNTDDSPFQSF